jgi:hypothetical protein
MRESETGAWSEVTRWRVMRGDKMMEEADDGK